MSIRVSPEEYARLIAKIQPKLKRRAKPRKLEEPIHKAIKVELERLLPSDWLVHHSRNGGRSKGENGKAKAMGAKKGWPDLEVLGREELAGSILIREIPMTWFFEVKEPNGVVDSEQKEIHRRIRALGYKVCVVRCLEDVWYWLRRWDIPTRVPLPSVASTLKAIDGAPA
jgi:hypothetical protein